jgi:hypothetical protein
MSVGDVDVDASSSVDRFERARTLGCAGEMGRLHHGLCAIRARGVVRRHDCCHRLRISQVMIEDGLLAARSSRTGKRFRRRQEHDGERAFVAPPRIARHGAQLSWLHEVAALIGVRRTMTGQRAVKTKRLPLALFGMRARASRKPGEVVPAADARRAAAVSFASRNR